MDEDESFGGYFFGET